MTQPAISKDISDKFRYWSFISMVLLVFVHGYNLQTRYLQPWTLPEEAMSITGFTEYFLANGLFRFRIPMLFIISGFLFALHDQRSYKERAVKRLRTLGLPYLIWSTLGILFSFTLELFPYTRDVVASSNILQIDDSRNLIHDYRWYEVLVRWLFFPIPYQLWFIRVLLIYNLAYPWIRWCVLHRIGRWIFFSVAALLWLSTSGFVLIEGEGILFFSLGIWIQKTGFNIEKPKSWLNPMWWGIGFILLSAGKTWLAFKGQPLLGNAIYPTITLMHKVAVFSGLVTCWFGLDQLVRWCMKMHWFTWLSAFAFMIYAMHTPLIAFAIDPFLSLMDDSAFKRIITFILLPVLVLGLCILTGALLRRIAPKLYGILTGGRGF